jgi:hypothetical protein
LNIEPTYNPMMLSTLTKKPIAVVFTIAYNVSETTQSVVVREPVEYMFFRLSSIKVPIRPILWYPVNETHKNSQQNNYFGNDLILDPSLIFVRKTYPTKMAASKGDR